MARGDTRGRQAVVGGEPLPAQQFFKWAVEVGELHESPMARMRPPKVPDDQAQVLSGDDLARLLRACAGTAFEDRRDEAIIRLFIERSVACARPIGIPSTHQA